MRIACEAELPSYSMGSVNLSCTKRPFGRRGKHSSALNESEKGPYMGGQVSPVATVAFSL